MTTYLVTGASEHLGRLTVEALLARGIPASDLVAITCSDTGASAEFIPGGRRVSARSPILHGPLVDQSE